MLPCKSGPGGKRKLKLHDLTLHQAHQLLRDKQITSVELTQSVLEHTSQVEDKVHALVTVTADEALRQAEEAD